MTSQSEIWTSPFKERRIWREGGIRTHGTVTRTTVFETALSQMGIGGRANSRWLQAPDLELRAEKGLVGTLHVEGPANPDI